MYATQSPGHRCQKGLRKVSNIYIPVYVYIHVYICMKICSRSEEDNAFRSASGIHMFVVDICMGHAHIWMSRVTHMSESYHTHVKQKKWRRKQGGGHINAPWNTCEWVMSHIWTSHIKHIKKKQNEGGNNLVDVLWHSLRAPQGNAGLFFFFGRSYFLVNTHLCLYLHIFVYIYIYMLRWMYI